MGIAQGLESLLIKVYGDDLVSASKMLYKAEATRNAPGGVYADYMFLVACYYASKKNNPGWFYTQREIDTTIESCIRHIEESFPNYDPSTRFTFDEVLPPRDTSAEEFMNNESLRYRIPVIGEMNIFSKKHPDFSFADHFGKYFRNAEKIFIKKS